MTALALLGRQSAARIAIATTILLSAGAIAMPIGTAQGRNLTIVTCSRDTVRSSGIISVTGDTVVLSRRGGVVRLLIASLWIVIEHPSRTGPTVVGIVIGAVGGAYVGSKIGGAEPTSGEWSSFSRSMNALDGGAVGLAIGSVTGGVIGYLAAEGTRHDLTTMTRDEKANLLSGLRKR
ncbi:MAG: hypothetical protein MUF78_07565 [Candidatus Edwardsbacteria bacterium]|nr:hypothetical protein [Candidatus Edwardsbacteria bacterium]